MILLADVNYIDKHSKELGMVIYQTLDEQDYPVNDYLNLIVAVQIEDDFRHLSLVKNIEEEDISTWIGFA